MKKVLVALVILFAGINSVNASDNLMKMETNDKVIFVSDEKGSFSYSWTFDKDEYNWNQFDFDLGINLSNKKKKNIEPLIKDDIKAKFVSFNYHGNLPSTANVKLPINDMFKDGDKLNLYYYNEKTNKIELVSSGVKVINGFATIEIEHCSDYFLTLSIVKEAEGKNNNGIIITGMIIVIVGLIGYTLVRNKK